MTGPLSRVTGSPAVGLGLAALLIAVSVALSAVLAATEPSDRTGGPTPVVTVTVRR